MKRLLHTPLALLVWRIVLLYAVLMLCRTAFYLYNAAVLGPLTWAEAWTLLAGALKFDTASVVYADVSRPTKSSSPTTTTRCNWSGNSWPKTGIWCFCGSP